MNFKRVFSGVMLAVSLLSCGSVFASDGPIPRPVFPRTYNDYHVGGRIYLGAWTFQTCAEAEDFANGLERLGFITEINTTLNEYKVNCWTLRPFQSSGYERDGI